MVHFWLKHKKVLFPVPNAPCILGRSTSKADIVLLGDRVSRRHASLFVADGDLWLRDLESRNGTYINGERISEATILRAGDIVTIGADVLEVAARQPSDSGYGKHHDPEDEVVTGTEKSAIALVEDLVARAAAARDRTAMATSIRDMIDAIADVTTATGRPLGGREAARVIAAARTVATWSPDGSLDGWCRVLAVRLEPSPLRDSGST